ncbi:hypothetical protein C8P63_10275 [Melghirimyces profundicolus]|uniref:Dimethylamine monooxygenase subunit DmmA-like C-terminal domain-containing protein n=1 Tax=Melghirimyces profundicolus TaxID=1242148 RepID=A0A2T6C8D7_9BACL|nr:dimethylamine monooxygenase subunit DmmA family protein [Melghirimyces profundicolus]PTX64581.1 hypothetical protein C8P63_10275 [Melghirimyces profundicolus]
MTGRGWTESLTVVPGRRKYILLTDSEGYGEIQPVWESLNDGEVPIELRFFQDSPHLDKGLEDWLSAQKMGTCLYIAGKWERVKPLFRLAERVGFTEEEMQVKGVGPREKRVFCARCHTINRAGEDAEIPCRECGEKLEVSSHYSRLHDACYGFVII